jgi:uncharacterized membrane protein
MTNKSQYLEELRKAESEHQKAMNKIVLDSIAEQESLIPKLYEEEHNIHYNCGERISDKIATFGGSWVFIGIFFFFISIWMAYNLLLDDKKTFDPYPFILLNLVLSCLAAIQAPVILMSQNRKETRDRKRAQDDYLINLKAEIENHTMDKKLDLLINERFKELIEIQEVQIKKLEILENILRSHTMMNGTKKDS